MEDEEEVEVEVEVEDEERARAATPLASPDRRASQRAGVVLALSVIAVVIGDGRLALP